MLPPAGTHTDTEIRGGNGGFTDVQLDVRLDLKPKTGVNTTELKLTET